MEPVEALFTIKDEGDRRVVRLSATDGHTPLLLHPMDVAAMALFATKMVVAAGGLACDCGKDGCRRLEGFKLAEKLLTVEMAGGGAMAAELPPNVQVMGSGGRPN